MKTKLLLILMLLIGTVAYGQAPPPFILPPSNLPSCSSDQYVLTYTAATNSWSCKVVTGIAGNPGGSSGDLQYNSSSSFAGITPTAGMLLYANATPAWTGLGKGTAYQVLGMNAGATLPAWTSTLGATGTRLTYGYFTDLAVTNAITGSVTGAAGNLIFTSDAQDDIPVMGATVYGRVNIAEQRIVGRITGGHVTGLTAAQMATLLGYAPAAAPTLTGLVTVPDYNAGVAGLIIGSTALQSSATKLNYISAAGGTTGTNTTNIVFSTSPTLVAPVLGAATATSINLVAITQPATGSTLTIDDGKVFRVSNTLRLQGTDSTTFTFPTTSGTVALSGTLTNSKWCTSDGTLIVCNTDAPTGAGTITAVGDIASGAAFTAGVPGKTLTWNNATSGTITMQAVTGALGSVTLSLPAATGTITVGPTTTTAGKVFIGTTTAGLGAWSTGVLSLGTNLTTATGAVTLTADAGGSSLTLPTAITLPAVVQGDLLYGSGANTVAVLTKSGTAGMYLKNSGTSNNPAWQTLDPAVMVIASQAAGDTLYASSTTAWARLAKGAAYSVHRMNSGATAPEWSTMTIDDSTSNVLKLANGTSSIQVKAGQALNFTGTFTDGYACTYTSSGTVIACNTQYQPLDATLTSLAAVSGVQGDILYASGADAWARLGQSTQYKFLITNGASANPSWSAYTMPASITAGDVLYGSGTNAVSGLSIGTVGKIMRTSGTAPTWTTLTMPDTIAIGSVFAANSANVLSAVTSSSGTYFLKNVDGTISWSTGVGTVTGPGTSTNRAIATWNSTGGTALYDNANATIDSSGNISGISLVLPASGTNTSIINLGSNTSSVTATGNQIFADTGSIIKVNQGGTKYALVLSPSAGQVTFSGPAAARAFTLPDANATILTTNAAVTVAQGGTGLTSGTSGGIPYYSSTSAMTSSALLSQYQIVMGGGAGAAPASLGSTGSSGNPLVSGGVSSNPSFLGIVLAGGTNTFSVTNGSASLAITSSSATLNGNSANAASGLMVLDSSGNANIPTGGSYEINGSPVLSGAADNARGLFLSNNTTSCTAPASGQTEICSIAGAVYVYPYGGASKLLFSATPGTPDGTKYLRDDGTWNTVTGCTGSFCGVTAGTNVITALQVNIGTTGSVVVNSGTLGATANVIPKTSGTGGSTLQAGSLVDTAGVITGAVSYATTQGTAADYIQLRPPSTATNPTYYRGWIGPTQPVTGYTGYILPDADPTAGQAMQFAAVSSNKSQVTWYTPCVQTELDLHAASTTITAAQIQACNATVATNVGQAAADVSNDLPSIAANKSMLFTVATTQSNYNRVCAPEGDNIYIDGAATSYDCVGFASGSLVQKNFFNIMSVRTGASSYVWMATSGVGTLTGYNGVKP